MKDLIQPSTYAKLPGRFFAQVPPTRVAKPRLLKFNHALAAELGIDTQGLDSDALAALFSGNVIPPGAEPIAMAYAGHQFGQFVPQLGDGRAILLGAARTSSGKLQDIQLKGSGRTPYSRGGDGRAALGPVLREYIVSEAMHALGIPTTRALAAVATGESVYREHPLPGAIVTRVASSFVRVGTFEFFGAREDIDAVRLLADYAIERHYPAAKTDSQPYLALLGAVSDVQASLIAMWMGVGFIHGVMNTDNMAISGETIDYGPCAFLDAYDPAKVFSSIDRQGRYAYSNQPHAAVWDLARFAETLLPLIDPVAERAAEQATAVLATFSNRFSDAWLEGLRRKLGLEQREDGDAQLAQELLTAMHANQADFTLTFRRLADAAEQSHSDTAVRSLFADPGAYDAWAVTWRNRLARETLDPRTRAERMRRANPAFIPRNHRIQQVIDDAVEHDDLRPFDDLLAVLARPYDDQPAFAEYANPPQPSERVLKTFCGT
jgi:serine/tyrosine/threonine adenylyltransferase